MFDFNEGIELVIRVAASLFCITFHEVSHGFVAYKLGDPTAKNMGRLTLNPIRHIDPWGLAMMVFARVGWAKAVPIDASNFKKPKRDMALTALAGPISNFILAFAAMVGVSACLLLANISYDSFGYYVLIFFNYVAVLSIGLGVFNLIPIPPLDGSKVLFSILPERAYFGYMRYERYGMLIVIALAASGATSGFINEAINAIYGAFANVIGSFIIMFR